MRTEPLKTIGHYLKIELVSSLETTNEAPNAPEEREGLSPILVLETVPMLILSLLGLHIPFLGLSV